MNESQRQKIEYAASAFARRYLPRFGINMGDIPAFIAGAEFGLNMVDCTRCYNDGYFQGCKDMKILDENVCVSKSAPSLEPRDHP